MTSKSDLLREVMNKTNTSQTELSRLSGVRQPSVSQFLSGKKGLSDEQLDRLLSCMGQRLEVVVRPVEPTLTRSEHRSWLMHRRVAMRLTAKNFDSSLPTMLDNLDRVRRHTRGQPHERNMDEWKRILTEGDVNDVKRMLTGLSRHAIEMREVSPMAGLLTEDERLEALELAGG